MSKKNKARRYWKGIAKVREAKPNHYVVIDGGGILNDGEYSHKELQIANDVMTIEYGQRKDGKDWIEIVTDAAS